jgi:hypothetical protein
MLQKGNGMKRYKVEVVEETISKYLIEANSEEEAIRKANNGEGDLINSINMGVPSKDRLDFVTIEVINE